MPDTGVLRVLTSQQRGIGWRPQLEVEKSLGLEEGAISSYFQQLERHSKCTSAARRQLRVAGVYRAEGLRCGTPRPPRNWWIAFAGKGNPRPVLALSRESHPFAPVSDVYTFFFYYPSLLWFGGCATHVTPCSVPGYSYFTMCPEKSEHNCLTIFWYNAATLASFFYSRV